MEKNAKGNSWNRETLPNPFLILKPVAEACHKLQASFGKHGHYVKICAGFFNVKDTRYLFILQWYA